MIDAWRGVVNVVLYRVQFADSLDNDLAAWMAERITTEPDELTADEQYTHLKYALTSDALLTDLIPDAHSEAAFRGFLAAVLKKMDALRPWPEPPFRPLPISHWARFADARVIARVGLDPVRTQDKIHQGFKTHAETGLKVLMLRMASGAEVAFVAPGLLSDTVDLVSRDPRLKPDEVIAELLARTRLQPEHITPLT